MDTSSSQSCEHVNTRNSNLKHNLRHSHIPRGWRFPRKCVLWSPFIPYIWVMIALTAPCQQSEASQNGLYNMIGVGSEAKWRQRIRLHSLINEEQLVYSVRNNVLIAFNLRQMSIQKTLSPPRQIVLVQLKTVGLGIGVTITLVQNKWVIATVISCWYRGVGCK